MGGTSAGPPSTTVWSYGAAVRARARLLRNRRQIRADLLARRPAHSDLNLDPGNLATMVHDQGWLQKGGL